MTAVALVLSASCSAGSGLPEAETGPAGDAGTSSSPVETDGSQDTTVPGSGGGDSSTPTTITITDLPTDEAEPDVPSADVEVVVDLDATTGDFDRRLLGTNVAAWEGADGLADPEFRAALATSGTTLLRMPGGSWSNNYDWLGCELSSEDECFWTWAARPADFVSLLDATGLPGMWAVSVNETAEQAAAAVAYFNGDLDDSTVIGVDRDGVDWGTVGEWAALRSDNGNPDPAGIELWEVGNEVYGASRDAGGDECASFGWEDVWTCDGTEYIEGDDEHDGYLAIRAAMRAVDPDISVGAVGVSSLDSWGDWAREVVTAAGDDLDFYVIHVYGFDESVDPAVIAARPRDFWPNTLDILDGLLDDVPIAVTEHNLVSFDSGDTEARMTQAINALYLSQTFGELAGAAPIANQWSFASGTAASGTNYGLIDGETLAPFPAFFTMVLWSRLGKTLHPVSETAALGLDVVAGSRDDGVTTVIVTNPTDADIELAVSLDGTDGPHSIDSHQLVADEATATTVAFNGTTADSVDDATNPPAQRDVEGATFGQAIPAWSVTLLEISESGA